MDSFDINALIAQIELGRTVPEPKILEKTPMTQFLNKPPSSSLCTPDTQPQSVKDRTQQPENFAGGGANAVAATNAPQQTIPTAHPSM